MAVLSLDEAKTHLNISADNTTYDDELSAFIDAAEARIAHECGPLESTAQTVRVRGGREALPLPVTPAVSLTSVTPVGGSALTLGDLCLDTSAGLVRYDQGGTFSSSWYTVVYQSGRTTVPEGLLMAVKELVRLGWKSQRGASKKPGSVESEGYSNTLPGVGEDLPFAVQKWMAGYLQPGFA